MKRTEPNDNQIQLFHQGLHFKSHNIFGAKVTTIGETSGVAFTLWAPNAINVSVVGDFNNWNHNAHPMKKLSPLGIWHLFIPKLKSQTPYMYNLRSQDLQSHLKADPYATFSQIRPKRASIVYELGGYIWEDQVWERSRKEKNCENAPLNIYELHAGSWKKKAGKCDVEAFYTYRELADELIPYLKAHKFTHVELMPITEHPYDPSWGYQGTGYFSTTSRYGTPHDLMYFIDKCHQSEIGVLLDWVSGHYGRDPHGLYMFDGTPTYEYQNPYVRENDVWGTANFDLGKNEVQSFLISSALFWLENFHFDGLRLDAVKEMLYWELDGDYQQKTKGSLQENELAVAFLQKLNTVIKENHPDALICAEDSSIWPGVTKPVAKGGLGFDYKWNMGWMNDVLNYIQTPFEARKHHHHKLTFAMTYSYKEQYILALSHDEVVHEKKSLLSKMPGDTWQKFAGLRLLYGFMYTHPGKKLLFMGGEFGQLGEWNESSQLEWNALERDEHAKMGQFSKDFLKFYHETGALWELDHHPFGFSWIDPNNEVKSIFSYIRFAKNGDHLIVICNFSPDPYPSYKIGVPQQQQYIEIVNSDDIKYGGSGQINPKPLESVNEPFNNQPCHIQLTIPPLGCTILKQSKQ